MIYNWVARLRRLRFQVVRLGAINEDRGRESSWRMNFSGWDCCSSFTALLMRAYGFWAPSSRDLCFERGPRHPEDDSSTEQIIV